jgi:hypothetical protein
LLVNNSGDNHSVDYHACPKCLTKIRDADKASSRMQNIVLPPKPVVAEETPTSIEAPVAFVEKDVKETIEGCLHHLGYLKQRPKNSPIPDECLTCIKMIDCTH